MKLKPSRPHEPRHCSECLRHTEHDEFRSGISYYRACGHCGWQTPIEEDS